ncbi:MAG: feruloyl-CoA synthase [Qingshengfaniella sp.]
MTKILPKDAPRDPAQRAAWARAHTLVDYLPHKVIREDRPDGTIRLRSAYDLGECAANTGIWLHKWAEDRPDTLAVSERGPDGETWRDLTYAQLLQAVRATGAALLARGLGQDDTIAILSGNGVDHLILSLGAQYVGVPTVPLAEQYSLIPEAHERLTYVLGKVKPKMAFVEDAGRYAAALALPDLDGVEVIATRIQGAPRPVIPFADLLAGDDKVDLDAAHARVGPDTLAKILFTSGSSSDPKGVLTTQRMICVNQEQLAVAMPFLAEKPPRITDWLPWNHVFGGNHNINMVLRYGGTLTIDHGKPTGAGFETTLKNTLARPATLAFNVPVGFSMMTKTLAEQPDLRARLLADMDMVFYAGASLPQDVWDRLEEYAFEVRGGLPLMTTSWGLTETAPAVLMLHEPIGRAGVVGVPLPGVEIKLIPDDDLRCEIRVKGPNIMPGYFDDPERTRKAFDEEGFFITGDAMRFVDPEDVNKGLIFDGRVSEDFKLDTGTWVQASTLRLRALERLAGLIQDVVVCGHDRGEVGLFIFALPGTATAANTTLGALTDDRLKAQIEDRLRAMNADVTGSAKRITRAIILADPPSVEGQEITDKGSLNVNKILTRRADLLERLYDNEDPALIRV